MIVDTPAAVAGRDATGLRWRFTWGAEVSGVDSPNRSQPTSRSRTLSNLPTPVRLTEILAVFIGPNGNELQRNSTSAEQLQGRVGANQIARNAIIPIYYDGVFTFGPRPTGASEVRTDVTLIDGTNVSHVISTTAALTFEDPLPRPCGQSRDPSSRIRVRITATGIEPMTFRGPRGPCVVFTNEDGVAHDIRSDSHPDHSSCSEFNVGMIAPREQKTTTSLQTFGTCRYHDDLRLGDARFEGSAVID